MTRKYVQITDLQNVIWRLNNLGVNILANKARLEAKQPIILLKASLAASDWSERIPQELKGVVQANLGIAYKNFAMVVGSEEMKKKYCEKSLASLNKGFEKVRQDKNKEKILKHIDSVEKLLNNEACTPQIESKTTEDEVLLKFTNVFGNIISFSNELAQTIASQAKTEKSIIKAQKIYKCSINFFKAALIATEMSESAGIELSSEENVPSKANILKEVLEAYIDLAKLHEKSGAAGPNGVIETYEKTGQYFQQLKLLDKKDSMGWSDLETNMMNDYKSLIEYQSEFEDNIGNSLAGDIESYDE